MGASSGITLPLSLSLFLSLCILSCPVQPPLLSYITPKIDFDLCLHFFILFIQGCDTWLSDNINGLRTNRELVWEALRPLTELNLPSEVKTPVPIPPTQGAIYFMARLPTGLSSLKVVQYLAHEHGVVVIPGAGFGADDRIRVSFSNLTTEECRLACERLNKGLEALVTHGLPEQP